MVIDYQNIFERIIADPRYAANVDWGKPRPGHPEGTVRAHIAELERNLETLLPKLNETECWKLKLLIHTHDTFKSQSQDGVAIVAPQSHASLARAFLASFCDDSDLQMMVQYHDEPFALYRQVETKGRYSQVRLDALLAAIQDWNLFLAFNIIDGCTIGKSREPLRWLFREVADKVQSRFTAGDLIERQ